MPFGVDASQILISASAIAGINYALWKLFEKASIVQTDLLFSIFNSYQLWKRPITHHRIKEIDEEEERQCND
jgi:hypothetical protein